jgi:hypothetical protein
MARGWESKAVEAQQEEASRDRVTKRQLTPAEQAAAERRAALRLTRARTAADLERAKAPHHRQMLERALAAIDEQLRTLES